MLKFLLRSLLALAIALMGSAAFVSAQEGELTAEETALLERLFNASQNREDYTSLILVSRKTESNDFSIYMGGELLQTEASNETIESSIVYIGGDNPNGRMTSRVIAEGDWNYEALGDLIYVDGVLYGLGIVESGELVFPDGFTILDLDDPLGVGDFSIFDPQDFWDRMRDEEDNSGNPLEDFEILREIAYAVVLEETEHNGQAVDLISFAINRDGFLRLAESGVLDIDNEDEMFLELFRQAEVDGRFAVALNADEQVVYQEFSFVVLIEGFDMQTLDEQFAGFTADFDIRINEYEEFTEINPTLDPIQAPAVAQ